MVRRSLTGMLGHEIKRTLLARGKQPKERVLALVITEINMDSIGDEQPLLFVLKFQNAFDGPRTPSDQRMPQSSPWKLPSQTFLISF